MRGIFLLASMAMVLILLATSGINADTITDSDSLFADPSGGWSYVYNGDNATMGATDSFDSLDGTWDHDNPSDLWTDPSKVTTDGDVLTIVDNLTGGDDRKIFFGHNLGEAVDGLVDSGVTLRFRASGDYAINSNGKGQIGIRQRAVDSISGRLVSFAFDTDAGGLTVNDGGGEDTGTLLYAIDDVDTAMHDYWITIVADDSVAEKTHKVTLWMDGDTTAKASVNINTAGVADYSGNNYLAIGLGASALTGELNVDYVAYQAAAIAPVPEPSTWLLAAVAVALFGAQRWRRRR